jgi:uncharacterized membrane protein
LLAALAYFTFVPAIIFLLLPQWKRNAYIRFHSYQSIYFFASCLVLALCFRLADVVLALLPLGLLLIVLTWGILAVAAALMWLTLFAKALQGGWFRIPFLGRILAVAHLSDQS